MNKIDVGGTEAFSASVPIVRGATGDSKFMVDGMDVSSPSAAGTIANFYLDPFSFEETSIQLGAGSAENSTGGINFNMITRSGTNRFHGGAKINGTTPGLANGKNYSDELRAQLLAGVPPKVLEANPDIEPGADIQKMSDVGAWLSGPIVRDKLWFAGTWHDQRMDQHYLGGYNPDGSQAIDDNVLWNYTAKVSWQATKSAQLSYFTDIQYKLNGHFVQGNTRASFGDDASKQHVYKYPTIHQVKFTTPIRNSMAFDIAYNRFRSDNAFLPQPEVNLGDIARFDSVTSVQSVAYTPGTCNVGVCDGYYTTPLFREQVRSSLSIAKSRHDLKVGYEFVDITRDTRIWLISPFQANYQNGLPLSVNTYTLPVGDSTDPRETIDNLFTYRAREHGVYAQDRWTVSRKVVVNLGLRYETNKGWQPPSCAPKSDFFAGACYDEVRAPTFGDFAPRSSVVWDMLGDGRTVLKGTANRYNAPLGVDPLGRLNPISAPSDTRQWLPQSRCNDVIGGVPVTGCDRNGDLVPTLNELGTAPGYVFAGVNARYQDDLQRPVVNEYTVEFQRELPQGIVVSAGYVKRQTRQNLAQRNTAVPESAWIGPITVKEVTSGETVQVWNRPSTASANLFYNSSETNTDYKGTDLSVTKRFSKRWSMLSGATFGRARQTTRGGNRNDPNIVNAYDDNPLSAADRPWSYRVSGNYRAALAGLRQRHLAAPGRRARDHDRDGDERQRDAGAGHAGRPDGSGGRRPFPERRAARPEHPQDDHAGGHRSAADASRRDVQPHERIDDYRLGEPARADVSSAEPHSARPAHQVRAGLRVLRDTMNAAGPGHYAWARTAARRGVTMTVRSRRGGYSVLAALGLWLVGLQASSSMQAPGVPAAAAQAPVEFNRDIRPILSDKCYTCHGPGTQLGGLRFDREDGAKQALRNGHTAIVPGDAERQRAAAARVRHRSQSADAAARRAARRATRWPCCGAGSSRARSGSRTGRSSRRRRRPIPAVAQAAWVRNPIDAFVLARLEHEGLTPSPEADRATLLRRVTLDLTGLPPTPAEVDAFLADTSPDAYEKVVDRLLASPRYGERMAFPLARRGPLRRHQRLPERRRAPHVALARLGDRRVQREHAVRPVHRRAARRRPAAQSPRSTSGSPPASTATIAATREGGIIPEEYAVEYVVDRVETTATVWLGLTGRLRPLPRPQVRPDHAEGVLPALRVLQQHPRERQGAPARQLAAVHQGADPRAAAEADAARRRSGRRQRAVHAARGRAVARPGAVGEVARRRRRHRLGPVARPGGALRVRRQSDGRRGGLAGRQGGAARRPQRADRVRRRARRPGGHARRQGLRRGRRHPRLREPRLLRRQVQPRLVGVSHRGHRRARDQGRRRGRAERPRPATSRTARFSPTSSRSGSTTPSGSRARSRCRSTTGTTSRSPTTARATPTA